MFGHRKYSIYGLLIGIFMATMLYFTFNNTPQKISKPHYGSNWNYPIQTELHKIYVPKEVDLVMLGDSHTYRVNWHELLGIKSVLNRGIDGDITEGFLHRVESILEINKPHYISVLGGYNDFRKGYEVEEVFENYKQIIQKIKNAGIKVIITATFYDINGNYKHEITSLNRLMKHYCNANNITYIDLNAEISKEGYLLSEFTADGIHLSAKGYTLWKRKLLPFFSSVE